MKAISIMIVVLAMMFNVKAQITFQKTYGGNVLSNRPALVVKSDDGGYVMAGNTDSYGAGGEDIYLVKTDESGDLLWTKTFGGDNVDVTTSIEKTTDGGFIITGQTSSFGPGAGDAYLIKTNSDGDTLWTKTYGQTSTQEGAYHARQTSDGGYIVVGFWGSSSYTYLIKTNSNGDTLWTRIYDVGIPFSVEQEDDGGYIIGGTVFSFTTSQDFFLLRTDASGNTVWYKNIGGTGTEYDARALKTSDGGYFLYGTSASFGANDEVFAVKTDSGGNVQWSQAYEDTLYSLVTGRVLQVNDGYMLFCSRSAFGTSATRLIKIDATGSVLWAKNYSPVAAGGIQRTADGGFILSAGAGLLYLIKTDSNGSACNETDEVVNAVSAGAIVNTLVPNELSGTVVGSSPTQVGTGGSETVLCLQSAVETISNDATGISVYPNPASDKFFVTGSALSGKATLSVYNSVGENVFEKTGEIRNEFEVDASNFSPGIYLVRLILAGKIYSQKIVMNK